MGRLQVTKLETNSTEMIITDAFLFAIDDHINPWSMCKTLYTTNEGEVLDANEMNWQTFKRSLGVIIKNENSLLLYRLLPHDQRLQVGNALYLNS